MKGFEGVPNNVIEGNFDADESGTLEIIRDAVQPEAPVKKLFDMDTARRENYFDIGERMTAINQMRIDLRDLMPTLPHHVIPDAQKEMKDLNYEFNELQTLYDLKLGGSGDESLKKAA